MQRPPDELPLEPCKPVGTRRLLLPLRAPSPALRGALLVGPALRGALLVGPWLWWAGGGIAGAAERARQQLLR